MGIWAKILGKYGRGLGAIMALWVPLLATASSPQSTQMDQYYAIKTIEGELIGWQHERLTHTNQHVIFLRERAMGFRVVDASAEQYRQTRQYVWDRHNHLLSFEQNFVRGGDTTQTIMTINGQTAHFTRKSNDQLTSTGHTVLPPQFAMIDEGAITPLLPHTTTPISARAGQFFAIASGHAGFIPTMRQTAPTQNTLTQNGIIVTDRLDGQVAYAWQASFDANGQLMEARQPLLGTPFIFTPVAGPVDLPLLSPIIHFQVLQFPFQVPPGARNGHIRYRLGLPAGLGLSLPNTPEQAVRQNGGNYIVDVCPNCGTQWPLSPTDRAQYVAANRWVEADDPIFTDIASHLDAYPTDTARMHRLGEIVRERLTNIDYRGHLSAKAAWTARRGDCTEFALLYAALARAANIPTRVVNGLVFSRAPFQGVQRAIVPHSWIVSYVDGHWQSFDVGMANFDAAHLAISLSDGGAEAFANANQIAGLLDWQSVNQVQTAATVPAETAPTETAPAQ